MKSSLNKLIQFYLLFLAGAKMISHLEEQIKLQAYKKVPGKISEPNSIK
jgi:hypothetical protein